MPSTTAPASARAWARAEQRDRRRDVRIAAQERRRYERREVRRFTRRASQRRITLAIIAGIIATLVGLVLVAVYSPLLALRTIQVSGTERIDPVAIESALSGQLGTPLALVDYARITRELSAFPLIRSYVTETVPPDTVRIQIAERQPIGVVQAATTLFQLLDPAGVTVQESEVAPPGVPLIELAGAPTSGPAFRAVADVLVSMPDDLRAKVTLVSARTKDDVRLVLSGVGQSVVWGSSADSGRKAALLAALIAVTDSGRPGEFDVSAPGNGIFRPS
ncbi:MAG: FtsQ-type POTRA domain-containing protein [Salinibacterium sp.]|nr:FtsQ-type POTRA domain-containing protein [Salinibacterium sp.]